MAIDRTQYNALVDDSGAGTDGTVWDKNKVKVVVLDPIDAMVTDPAAFTPTIVSSGGGAPTYGTQVGRYQRTNGYIQFSIHITLATFGTLAAGNITIGGLPVTSLNLAGVYAGVHFSYWDALTTAVVNLSGFVAPNTAVIVAVKATAATTGITSLLTKADLSATTELIITGQYPVT